MVLDFFSVDCEPCKREMTNFLSVAAEFKGKGALFFVVCTDPPSREDDVRKLVETMKIDCDVLCDSYRVAFDRFGLERIPRTVVVGKNRKILGVIAGAHDDFEKTLRDTVSSAVSGK